MSNRYEIEKFLEHGHYGDLFLAQDLTLNRKVAFRKFTGGTQQELPEDFTSFKGKLAALNHPNLRVIYDINSQDGEYFMISQFTEAERMIDRMAQGPTSVAGVHNMAVDVLDALHALHSVGLIHGALCRESVTRVPRVHGGFRYFLEDVGLRQLSSIFQGIDVDPPLALFQTPERLETNQAPQKEDDLFALGQLCYFALLGDHPMKKLTASQICHFYRSGKELKHLNLYMPEIQTDFADWVMSLISKNPADRPKSLEAAMISLRSIKIKTPYTVKVTQNKRHPRPQLGRTAPRPQKLSAVTAATPAEMRRSRTDMLLWIMLTFTVILLLTLFFSNI